MRKKRNILKRNSGFVIGCVLAAGASFLTAHLVLTDVLSADLFMQESSMENETGEETEEETTAIVPEETEEDRTYETDAFMVTASGTVSDLAETETDAEDEDSETEENTAETESEDAEAEEETGEPDDLSESAGNEESGGESQAQETAAEDRVDSAETGGDNESAEYSGSAGTASGNTGTGSSSGSTGTDGSSGSTGTGSSSGSTGTDSSSGSAGTGGSSDSASDSDDNITIWSGSGSGSSGSSSSGSSGSSGSSNTSSDEPDTIISGISSRYISESELYGYSLSELRLIRNEIFALHGRMFKSEDLQEYFNQKSWYVPLYTPEEFDADLFSHLNEYEKANLNVIIAYEEALGG